MGFNIAEFHKPNFDIVIWVKGVVLKYSAMVLWSVFKQAFPNILAKVMDIYCSISFTLWQTK